MNPAIAAARRNAPPGTYWACYVGLLLTGLSILFALSLGEPRLLHWYVIPVFLCLLIVCLDTAHLACGNVSFFSPVGLFGLFGFHFFFLAPLLNVYLDYWMNYTVMPEDWRPWLGGMACLNLIGLLAFRIGRQVVTVNSFIVANDRELEKRDSSRYPQSSYQHQRSPRLGSMQILAAYRVISTPTNSERPLNKTHSTIWAAS